MGDPSGKDKARPILGEHVVKANAERILEQVSKILSPGFEVHRNHEFFEGMNIPFFLTKLASQFTVARMMSRDGFRKRGQAGVAMHELITPLLQGWDSVMVKADVEIGGTDQLFNFQVSRELQAKQGQTPQVCMMTPIINGTDGRKMSKSLDNCIWLEEPPEQIFGKVMSISDDVMSEWIPLLTDIESFPDHPMRRKEMLARDIVRQIHGEEAAEFAASHFKSLIQNKQATDIVSISSGSAIEVVVSLRGCSKSEARRLIKGGGLKACNKLSSIAELKRVSDENFPVPAGWLIKIGKRQWAITVD
jgi:tyrosyl-tRNA synthetase